jgi:hypothetical protein
MGTFIINRKDISNLHNGKCALHALQQIMQENFKETSFANKYLDQAMKYLVPTINKLMDEVDKAEQSIQDQLKEVRTELCLMSFWSVPCDRVFPQSWAGKKVTYQGYALVIPEDTKIDYTTMYVIGDRLIEDSGDQHHVFIEDFIEKNGKIELVTGS